MTIHVSATTGCNLGCDYCYENPDRERSDEWVKAQYDMDHIMEQLREWKEKYPNTVPGWHGGEPLLLDIEDLEQVFEFVYNNYDEPSHIQTNGTLLSEEHIEVFSKYNVSVGISCDGPGELNKLRKAAGERGTDVDSATDNMTLRTQKAIEKCIENDVTVNIITVLSEQNAATDEKYEALLDWIDWLNRHGVHGHFNPAIPYDDIQDDVSLSGERLKECYLRLWEWMKEERYRSWGPANFYVDNLIGARLSNCVNNKCDVANAGAAMIIKGNGETTGCGKTWSAYGDGVPFLQGDSTDNEYDDSEERYEVLKETPGPHTEGDEPDMGGCKGCKYWNVCNGGCPSAGMNDDFRNRTVWCEAKYALYERVEEDLRALMPNIRLITDLPWDVEVSEYASSWQLDIKPFAAMRPGIEGQSSAAQGYEHDFPHPRNMVPDEAKPELTWEEEKDRWREMYDEESLSFDDSNKTAHADDAIRGQSEDDWEVVEE